MCDSRRKKNDFFYFVDVMSDNEHIDGGNPPTQSTRYRATSSIGVSVITRGLSW